MREFRFLKNPIAKAHDGGYIYAGQWFYTMNKEEIVKYTYMGERKVTPKYTIVTRFIPKVLEDRFKPDYDELWYFRSKYNAEYLRTLWMNDDKIQEAGEIFYKQSDITITF